MDESRPGNAEILLTGRLDPEPLSRLLPVGTPVTIHLELTLQGTETPFTFNRKGSFVEAAPSLVNCWQTYKHGTDERVGRSRVCDMYKHAGPVLDPKTDLITLYPGVPVSMTIHERVCSLPAAEGKSLIYAVGVPLCYLEPGQRYILRPYAHRYPIDWHYWGPVEQAIASIPDCFWDDAHDIFRAPITSYNNRPRFNSRLEYTVAEEWCVVVHESKQDMSTHI